MDISVAFQEIAQSNPTLAFLALIGANLVAGVIVALKDGKFEWSELAGIFTKVWPLLGSYAGLQVAGEAIAGSTGEVVQTASWLAMLPFILGIWNNIKVFLPKRV